MLLEENGQASLVTGVQGRVHFHLRYDDEIENGEGVVSDVILVREEDRLQLSPVRRC